MQTALERLRASGIPLNLIDPAILDRARLEHVTVETNGVQYAPWVDGMAWRSEINVQADSYQPFPKGVYDDIGLTPKSVGCSFTIERKTLKHGQRIRTYAKPQKQGWASFDKDVDFVVLQRSGTVVMSTTPMELLTLTPGVRRAHGDVVITGLGLGWMLLQVSRRRTKVRSITVVEIDGDLVREVMPRIQGHLEIKPTIIQGDASTELKKLTGDVLLLDHFDSFGYNKQWLEYSRNNGIRERFKSVWVWG